MQALQGEPQRSVNWVHIQWQERPAPRALNTLSMNAAVHVQLRTTVQHLT
jgi:hypothetical protein